MSVVSLAWPVLLSWAGLSALVAAYPHTPLVSASALPAGMQRLDANLGDRIELLGFRMRISPMSSGDLLEVTPYWHSIAAVDVDYTVTVQVFDQNGTRIGQLDTYPVHGMSLTHDWRPGDIVQDHYPLLLSAPGPRPLHASVVIGMYDLRDGHALQVIGSDGRRSARVSLGQLEIDD